MSAPTYRDGTPAPAADLDVIARAFGFNSARHMDAVAAGKEPTALANRQMFYAQKRRAS